jgi:2-polyprenyl-6-methoxyphenol hydroxylase-like FAD-dependent oxidoreductase
VIVGAGPAGLLLGLRLAKENIDVTLVDMGHELDTQPRATHYASPAVQELRKAGVLEDVRARGFTPDGVCWRKLDQTYLAGIQMGVVKGDPDAMVCLPLNQLGQVFVEHLKNYPSAKILWSHEVIGIEQDEKAARVTCKTPNGEVTIAGDYVVGCDGANSKVRRALFGDWEFPGKTWAEQIVATNVSSLVRGSNCRSTIPLKSGIILTPTLSSTGNTGTWPPVSPTRACGESPTVNSPVSLAKMYVSPLSSQVLISQLIARQPMKFETMLPGNPKPGEYKLTNISPYKIHQRCAEKFRVGRFLLVADAAHLCNPFGGLGLTGGMVDAGNLADCIIGVAEGIADSSIFDKYDEIRRAMWHKIINPVSSDNILRLHSQDPDKVLENDEFLITLAKAEKDPKLMEQMIVVSSRLRGFSDELGD